jgi:phosphatidylethanolamine/phosphatidyl-N-methylethanolamine N-methyltransferase
MAEALARLTDEDRRYDNGCDGLMWNRLRYTAWAPLYDAFARVAGFSGARRQSIERLGLREGDRVLIAGAGTGLDLDFLPPALAITAIDVTPAMLRRLTRRAARAGRPVSAQVMDARSLAFPDASFDAVIMHLILAVMPEPERGLKEAARVLKPGGRIAVFDKFLRDDEQPSRARRLLNLVSRPLFSDINRRLGPLVRGTGLIVERDEPAALDGVFRSVTLSKPFGQRIQAATPGTLEASAAHGLR